MSPFFSFFFFFRLFLSISLSSHLVHSLYFLAFLHHLFPATLARRALSPVCKAPAPQGLPIFTSVITHCRPLFISQQGSPFPLRVPSSPLSGPQP
ncbi:hypothetical protein IWZ03DRAFT_376102 [Phyllosticta citriasiana]|uniref:Secreted protein n=1 Tax=Phyllosticta citriasiana TaxID=595635 RepID=A0ABR1KRH3_9PEZI